MAAKENVIRFYSDDKVEILTCTVCMPDDLTPRALSFYESIRDAFIDAVREQYRRAALEAYNASDDKRKRYRYTPMKVRFTVTSKKDCTVMTVCGDNGAKICERHIWKDDILLNRRRES